MALKNLEIWQGAWGIITQHDKGKLITAGSKNDSEHKLLNGNLVLKKKYHEAPVYNFCLSIPLKTVDSDTILFRDTDKRTGGEKSYEIKALLVRYRQPTGSEKSSPLLSIARRARAS